MWTRVVFVDMHTYEWVSRGQAERIGRSRNEHRNQGHNYKWGLTRKEYAIYFYEHKPRDIIFQCSTPA